MFNTLMFFNPYHKHGRSFRLGIISLRAGAEIHLSVKFLMIYIRYDITDKKNMLLTI